MIMQIMLRARLIMGIAGVLILATLGSPAVLDRDDEPAKAKEGKVQDDKSAKAKEGKVQDDKSAKAKEGKVRDAKLAKVEEAEDNAIQIGAQFAPYFNQIYKKELRYMRLVAEPTKQQYEKIEAESEASVKVALREYTKRFTGGGNRNNTSNPIQPITDAITKAVKKHLTPEQAGRYQKEFDAQLAACKRMAVDNLVVMVDKALNLSTDQRSKLADILLSNWDDSWSQTQYYFNDGRWFPAMPDGKISPILTESQRDVWNEINKNIINFGIFRRALDEAGVDEDWPEDGPKKSEVLPLPREKAPNGGGKK
jgi:hypothetical protein